LKDVIHHPSLPTRKSTLRSANSNLQIKLQHYYLLAPTTLAYAHTEYSRA